MLWLLVFVIDEIPDRIGKLSLSKKTKRILWECAAWVWTLACFCVVWLAPVPKEEEFPLALIIFFFWLLLLMCFSFGWKFAEDPDEDDTV